MFDLAQIINSAIGSLAIGILFLTTAPWWWRFVKRVVLWQEGRRLVRAVVPGAAVSIALGAVLWLWLERDSFFDPNAYLTTVDYTESDRLIDECIEILSERHGMRMDKSEPGPGSRVYDMGFCAGALNALDTR